MSDLDVRVKKSLKALLDSQSPDYKRIVKALKAFHGLDLGAISVDARSLIEDNFVKLNVITEKYHLKEFSDYKSISKADLNMLIKNQIILCNGIKSLGLKHKA